MKTMDTRVGDSLVDRRTPLVLAWIFAGVSLALTVVGIYSVLSFSVAQRRREIGVRMALARVRSRLWGSSWHGPAPPWHWPSAGPSWGVACGSRAGGALYGVTPASPLVLCCTAALLAAVAMPACLLPSQRAAHVAPAEALRSD